MNPTTPRQLHIPALPQLDDASAPELAALLSDRGAEAPIDCVNWPGAYPEAPEASVRIAHTDTFLYALFSIRATELRAMAAKDLDPVAQDTCFEMFLRPAGAPLYCNFEFNYLGVANVSRRPGRRDAVKFTPDLLARLVRIPLSTAAPHDNRPADPATPARLIVKIPLDIIGFDTPVTFPARMEGNIYCCSDKATRPYYLSWAPIATEAPDFHRPDFFASLILL